MIKFVVGFVFGLVVATVGFSGVATIADRGVDQAKVTLQEQAKPR